MRQRFNERPIHLGQRDCLSCDYLSPCAMVAARCGPIPVHGTLFEKDPYCELYKAVFGRMERAAQTLAREAVAARGVAA